VERTGVAYPGSKTETAKGGTVMGKTTKKASKGKKSGVKTRKHTTQRKRGWDTAPSGDGPEFRNPEGGEPSKTNGLPGKGRAYRVSRKEN